MKSLSGQNKYLCSISTYLEKIDTLRTYLANLACQTMTRLIPDVPVIPGKVNIDTWRVPGRSFASGPATLLLPLQTFQEPGFLLSPEHIS